MYDKVYSNTLQEDNTRYACNNVSFIVTLYALDSDMVTGYYTDVKYAPYFILA